MKFRILNEPVEETVAVRISRQGESVQIYLGPYPYITIRPNGTVRLKKFFRTSPMHEYCLKHNVKLESDDGETRLHLALEVTP